MMWKSMTHHYRKVDAKIRMSTHTFNFLYEIHGYCYLPCIVVLSAKEAFALIGLEVAVEEIYSTTNM